MSEPWDGLRPGPGRGPRRSHRNVPQFVVGCEDDGQDLGQMEAGMKNDVFREADMEDEEDESVSK